MKSGGLFDPKPLRGLVERYVDPEMLARIAAEYRRGRRLLVVTTNLDAQRPVVWDMGAIAASDRADALALFRDVIVASASVPAIYPPVLIRPGGSSPGMFKMHVDGAITDQVFIAPELFVQSAERRAAFSKVHIWVIVNNTLSPEYAITTVGAISIASRSLATLVKSQTSWIIKAAQERATRMGIDFHLAYISDHVDYDATKPFSLSYMTRVYDIGYRSALADVLWKKSLMPWTHPASSETRIATAHKPSRASRGVDEPSARTVVKTDRTAMHCDDGTIEGSPRPKFVPFDDTKCPRRNG